jgi:DNA-binding NarL/FixJ family response regulator
MQESDFKNSLALRARLGLANRSTGATSREPYERDVRLAARIRVWQLKKVCVLLADDHPNFPELVESLLEPGIEVVGKVGDGRALFEAALDLKPDLIVMDISMPILNGIDAADALRRSGCTSKIIFLTVHSDRDLVRTCLATGAFGYIVKYRVALDLLPAIREALAGHLFVSPNEPEKSLS